MMNAIVVLCHFCEQHGASVILCTQPYRQNPTPRPSNTNGNGMVEQQQLLLQQQQQSNMDYSGISRNSTNLSLNTVTGAGGCGDGQDVPSCLTGFGTDVTLNQPPKKQSPAASQQQFPFTSAPGCRACSYTRDELGMISQDQAANISYISTQWPKDPDLVNFVWTACQRSLSYEVCPGPEGAFYFGDETNGHVVSFNFHIKDARARGLQCRYSFLVLSWDRVSLLNLWPFLVPNLSKMAARLKQAAQRVFTSEMPVEVGSAATVIGLGSSSSHSIIGHIGRGSTPPSATISVFSGQAAGVTGNIQVPSGPTTRQRRALDADMRSLADLTKDEQIFYRVHAWFTWLLRAGARRWTTLPSLTAPPNEDDLVESEERQNCSILAADQIASASGSINTVLGGALLKGPGGTSASLLPSAPMNSLNSGTNTGGFLVPPFGTVGSETMSVGKSLDIADGSMEEENAISMLVLRRLYTVLGVNGFSRLAQQIVIGNQLVVQPFKDNLLGCLVIAAVAKLLPKGCLKQVVISPEYLLPFHCNLLSLSKEAKPVEPNWHPGEGVQFLAVFRIPTCLPSSASSTTLTEMGKYREFIESLHFRLCSTMPSVDPELKALLANSSQVDSLATSLAALSTTSTTPIPVSSLVTSVVQILSLQPQLPSSSMFLALTAARQEWINRARLLYSFKRCQGPTLTGEETTRRWAGVLSAIDCSAPENASVARFWQGALSRYSRQNTCHARRGAPVSTSTSRRGSCCSSTADLTSVIAAVNSTADLTTYQ